MMPSQVGSVSTVYGNGMVTVRDPRPPCYASDSRDSITSPIRCARRPVSSAALRIAPRNGHPKRAGPPAGWQGALDINDRGSQWPWISVAVAVTVAGRLGIVIF